MLTLLIGSLVSLSPQGQPPGHQPEPMPTPRTIAFRRAEDRTVTIDGSLHDWPPVPALRLDDGRLISGTAYGVYTGADDLSAQAFLLWDDEHLFFAAKVLDDLHWKLTDETVQRTEIPPTDSIILTFDPFRDTRAIGADRGRSEDAAFWLSHTDGRDVIRWDRLVGGGSIAKAKCAVARDDEHGLTTYEARIRWSDIMPAEIEVSDGLIFDMHLVINDQDVPEDAMPDTRIGWTFGTGVRIDPGLFGSVKLTDRVGLKVEQFELGEFPPPPPLEGDPVPPKKHWIDLHDGLRELPLVVATDEHVEPEFAGGKARKSWLERLDQHHAEFPRYDYLRFHMCVQRRMVREVGGMIETGLPFYWDHALKKTRRAAQRKTPDEGYRLFRLPHSGWLVRSKQANFLIDPAGFGIARELRDYMDFMLLTSPLDITRRNDQVAVRLFVNKEEGARPIFAHIAETIPGLNAANFDVVVPGKTYETHGLEIQVVGRTDERGWVLPTVGYVITWPDGSTLVVSGTFSLSEDVRVDGKPDIAIVSAKHPYAHAFAHRVGAGVTVIGDVLQCATLPGPEGRVSIDDAYQLQRRLRPNSSVLLAPSEFLDSHKWRVR